MFEFSGNCAAILDISDIPGVACAVSDTCLSMSCCIFSNILKRSFELSFEIDVCRYVLELQIESYKSTLVLDTSELGDWKFFTLQGLLKIRFVLHFSMYHVTVHESKCYVRFKLSFVKLLV
jgi:hypothetical protein